MTDTPAQKDDRNLAVGCHLLAFLAFLIPFGGNLIGPLALWLFKRNESEFVDRHGLEAVNFQVSMLIYWVVGGVLAAVLFWTVVVPILVGIALAILAVIWFVTVILAAMRASNGEDYRYPLTLRLIS